MAATCIYTGRVLAAGTCRPLSARADRVLARQRAGRVRRGAPRRFIAGGENCRFGWCCVGRRGARRIHVRVSARSFGRSSLSTTPAARAERGVQPRPRPALKRVAVLSDVHGNAPALEAVLAEVVRPGGLVVFGGDLVGPAPGRAFELVRSLGADFVARQRGPCRPRERLRDRARAVDAGPSHGRIEAPS